MKPIAIALMAIALTSAHPVYAGNLSEPIIEPEPTAAVTPAAPSEADLVARDAIADETRAASDGSWLVPALFLVFGGAVAGG